jgi:hypothetical protein
MLRAFSDNTIIRLPDVYAMLVRNIRASLHLSYVSQEVSY